MIKKGGENNYKSSLTDLIDDRTYGRFDKRKCVLFYGQYLGGDQKAAIEKKALERIVEAVKQNKPGLRLKDIALMGAARLQSATEPGCPGPNKPNVGVRSWTQVSKLLLTPQKLGLPMYQGDPKETAKVVKHVAKSFGACRVGITGLDRRHIYQFDCDGKEIAFEPVEEPYENEERNVIPEKCKYVVVMLVEMSAAAIACYPFPIGSMMPILSYNRIDQLTGATAEFIRGLGFTAIPSANDIAPNAPFAIEAGLGELCRMDKVIHPEFGPLVRICKIFTDLPMELDHRKESGITDFCKVCRRCVRACPVKAVNTNREPSFEVPGPWVNPGHKTWHGDNLKCKTYSVSTGGTCGICLNVCPWNKPKGLIHSLIRAIIKRTSLFNRLFVAADRFFGYGKSLEPEKWWKLELPTYGIDTRR